MPTREELGIALKNAHTAGDAEAARKLAAAIQQMDMQPSVRTTTPDFQQKPPHPYADAPPSEATGKPNFNAMPEDAGRRPIAGLQDYLVEQANEDPELNNGSIRSGADALLFNLANTALFGQLREAGNKAYEGTSQEGYGDKAMLTSEMNYPMASITGRGIGFGYGATAPSMGAAHLTESLATRAGLKLAGKGGTNAARAARYGVRLPAISATGAAEVAAFDALSEEPTQAFVEGRPSTLADKATAGVHSMQRPVNWLVGPGASVIGRVGRTVVKGSPTPSGVQESVFRGGGPAPLEGNIARNSDLILNVEASALLNPKATQLTERILRNSGLSPEDILALNKRAREFVEAAPDGVSPRLTIGQIYSDILYQMDKPQAAENIIKVLRERRNVTKPNDRSPAIVGNTVNELRGSQVPFLDDSLQRNLGSGRSLDTVRQVDEWQDVLGKQYEALFAPGASAPKPGSMDALNQAITYWRNEPKIMAEAQKIAAEAARRDGIPWENALEHYIQTDPRRAAHWMKSSAGELKRVEANSPSPNEVSKRYWENIETDLASIIDDAAPGYKDIRTSFAQNEGVRRAADFGDRFLTMAASGKKTDRFIDEFNNLSPTEQEYALESIREALQVPLRGGGEDMPARLARLNNIGTLDLLEQLGPKGKAVADDIRAIGEESRFLNLVDSGNPARQSATFSNADAASSGPDLYSGRAANALGGNIPGAVGMDVGVSALSGAPIPWFTMRSGLQSALRPRTASREAMTEFLMMRPHAGARPVPPSGAPPAPQGPGLPPRGVSPGFQRANALATNQSGSAQSGFTADMAPAAAGSVGGSVYGSQNDLNGDGVIDEQDAQIGALGGMVAGGLGSAGIRGANRIGRAPLGAPTQYRVRPGESGTFNVQSRAGGQRWQRDNYPFATAKEAQAEIASRQGGNAPAWQVDDAIRAVRNSKTPQEFWDNVRTIPEGPKRDGVMREMMQRAQSAEERSIVLDKFMGAASDWKQRERIARQFLRDHPLEWAVLKDVWPSKVADPFAVVIDGVPPLMTLVSEEAPALAKTVANAPDPVLAAWGDVAADAAEREAARTPRLATDNGAPVPQPERPQAPTADIVPFRKPEPPKLSGINALAGPAGGAFTGGVMPIPSTGNPEQDRNNRLMAIAGGALAGSRTGRRAIQDVAQGGITSLRGSSRIPSGGYDKFQIGKASVEVTRMGDQMTINRINVPQEARGGGEASKALKEILRQADEEGVTVFLTADPVGSGGLSKRQLEAFYGRHGFAPNRGANKDFSNQAGMVRRPMSGASMGGRPPKLPKIMKDVPKGRPPAQGNPRLGTGNFLKEQVDNTRPPRLAEGPMTDTQIAARRKQEAVNPLLNQGLSADAIKQQTGIQTMVYKGKAFILPESTNSMTSEQVQRAFYDSFALPFEQRPGWVKQILRATADDEGKALAAQGLWDSKNPVVLGTERTPMIRPGPNVPPENLNALARMPEPRR